jgi:hypothetical protein
MPILSCQTVYLSPLPPYPWKSLRRYSSYSDRLEGRDLQYENQLMLHGAPGQ